MRHHSSPTRGKQIGGGLPMVASSEGLIALVIRKAWLHHVLDSNQFIRNPLSFHQWGRKIHRIEKEDADPFPPLSRHMEVLHERYLRGLFSSIVITVIIHLKILSMMRIADLQLMLIMGWALCQDVFHIVSHWIFTGNPVSLVLFLSPFRHKESKAQKG